MVGTLSVREDWINFVDIKSSSFGGKIGDKARRLFESADQNRKRMFTLLLRHLSAKGLSRPSRPEEAVLAVFPLAVRPETDQAMAVDSEASEGRVTLDSEKLDTFLASSPGNEVETLVSLGVSHDLIRGDAKQAKAESQKSGLFTAGSSPLNALHAYAETLERTSVPRNEWESIASKRVLTDLVNSSFLLVEMVIELQEEFDIRFQQADMNEVSTVGQLLDLADSRMIGSAPD